MKWTISVSSLSDKPVKVSGGDHRLDSNPADWIRPSPETGNRGVRPAETRQRDNDRRERPERGDARGAHFRRVVRQHDPVRPRCQFDGHERAGVRPIAAGFPSTTARQPGSNVSRTTNVLAPSDRTVTPIRSASNAAEAPRGVTVTSGSASRRVSQTSPTRSARDDRPDGGGTLDTTADTPASRSRSRQPARYRPTSRSRLPPAESYSGANHARLLVSSTES